MKANNEKNVVVKLDPPKLQKMSVVVDGLSPLIQHKWSEKAMKMIRDKKGGQKTKDRSACDPNQEFLDATHRTEDGDYGVPVDALKASFIGAAHKDIGIEKTLVRKALFIECNDANRILKMDCSEPIMREDAVRVGNGGADLRYRPEFRKWSVPFNVTIDRNLLTEADTLNLINRAGFGVGICEWRPEKGGEFGRFEVRATR